MRGEYDDEEDWVPVEDLIAGLDLDPFDPLSRTGSDPPAGTRAIRWRDVPPELAAVEWVTTRFDIPLTTIPPCWWKHPALVEELSALHVAWRTAYDKQDTGLGPVMWLERWHAAKTRLREAYPGSCTTGHKDPKRRSWDGVTDQGEWETWAKDAHGE